MGMWVIGLFDCFNFRVSVGMWVIGLLTILISSQRGYVGLHAIFLSC